MALPILSCSGSPISAPDARGAAPTKISFEPSSDAAAVPSVVRVRIESASLDAGQVGLFEGVLSSYFLARIKSGTLPDTLAARQVPVVSWRKAGALLLAPVRPLAPGDYSLAAASGSVGQFQVTATLPLLHRLWPPAATSGSLAHVVYCGDASAPLNLDALDFEPGELSIAPLPGVDESGALAERCLHFDSDVQLGADEIVVPPPVSGAWALDPAPFSRVAAEPTQDVACTAGEAALGPGCARAEDDRVLVRAPEQALAWLVHTAHAAVLEITRSGSAFVVRGLVPGSTERLWGTVYDASGAKRDFDISLVMAAARERPVLNEVLANALGPEPQSEWIELVNDGTLPLDLAHLALRDAGGITPLPKEVLAVGEYALLVRDDFAASPADIPPIAGTRLIHVPQLGSSGLSNSGESLALIDSSSASLSVLPAVATKAGQSLTRRHPYSPDDDPSAFSTGVPTPGAPNE